MQPYKSSISEAFKDFPSSSLGLLTMLLALDPSYRGSAASALQNEVSSHCSQGLSVPLFRINDITKCFPCKPVMFTMIYVQCESEYNMVFSGVVLMLQS